MNRSAAILAAYTLMDLAKAGADGLPFSEILPNEPTYSASAILDGLEGRGFVIRKQNRLYITVQGAEFMTEEGE